MKPMEISIKTVDVLAEVRTGHLPHTSENCYRWNQLPWYMKFNWNVIEFCYRPLNDAVSIEHI
jgi:hypothetical protein